jgi:carbamoyltransferase
MNILGISAYYHDSAACLVQDGRIVAAAQEEAFTRIKHDAEFPKHAVAFCLKQGNIRIQDIDFVAFYEKPFLKFERLLQTYLAFAPQGLASFLKAMPVWLKKKLWLPDVLAKELDYEGTILFPEHHESHAASAFYASPFQRAAFLTTDGVGEWTTTSWGTGNGNNLDILSEIEFPHSLGLLYSAFTYFTGFRVNSGEYKLMGLAPYGKPQYVQTIRDHLIDIKDDGSYRLNLDYFTFPVGLEMTGKKFADLFGGEARKPESPMTQREMDLARSIQVVTEEVILKMAQHIHHETGEENLCLAGGVALNCVANGKLLRESPFKNLWIQPASGDAGGALGAALMVWHDYLGKERIADGETDFMRGSYLGASSTDEEIEAFLTSNNIPFEQVGYENLPQRTAKLLATGKVVGWFQGQMEFGPRALGNRSILADSRGQEVQKIVNLKIKFRESFRPFAPSVLQEKAPNWFDLSTESPYMLLVADVHKSLENNTNPEIQPEIQNEPINLKPQTSNQPQTSNLKPQTSNLKPQTSNLKPQTLQNRLTTTQATSPIPAVTHVDGSARVQTVSAAMNPLYHRLLEAFEQETGCPVLVNTSFNVRGEPIVCTPEDAFRCFRNTHLDVLVLGSYLITKDMLPEDQRTAFSPEEIAAQYGLD